VSAGGGSAEPMKVSVLGATGKTGRFVVARLCEDGHAVTAIGRAPARLARLDARAESRIADLEQPRTLALALADADCVISLAHARFADTVLAALPESCGRVVLTGSTRKFTALPDPAAEAVRRGEASLLKSGRAGVMLHPSMIYGAPEDRNINRVLRLVRRWPAWLPVILPLPSGGAHLVQPVFVDDVVDAVVAAATRPEALGAPIIVAGPEPITYAEMMRTCARALGRRLLVLAVPAALLIGIARLIASIGLTPPFDAAEIRRAGEDKAFEITDMRTRLAVTPRRFADGVQLKIARGWY